MSGRLIGEVAMTAAQRQQRYRDKLRAARPAPAPTAFEFLAGGPEAIAERILGAVPVDMARGIAMALQQRLMQGGSWPPWLPPIL
jgi:hypothetical protein